MNKIDIEKMKTKAIAQFKTGKSLFGKGGAFAPLLQEFLQEALEAEMDAYLTEEERAKGNKRNDRGEKTVKSSIGSFKIHPPEDMHYDHQPTTLPKRETILADSLAEKIIGLYGIGMSYRDISKHIEEMYGSKVSHNVLVGITDRIISKVKAWQNRSLDEVYPIVFLDAMHQKIQQDGVAKVKALYSIIGYKKY